jgi:hypothetical protein
MRKFVALGALAVAMVVGATVASSAGSKIVKDPMKIKVIERANTDTVIDTGRRGDTTGDLLTWHNPIFNAKDTHKTGHDQGDCIRINPRQGTWECRWITWVPGGAITVEGPFYDTHDNTMAITGGTGVFKNARGTMDLISRMGGTEYAFVFNVIP